MGETTELRKTPLNQVHRAAGAKMVDFGGWDMPVHYSGILDEHAAVRTNVGLFDVSHMGEIEIRGPRALNLIQTISTNNAAKLFSGAGALLRPALRAWRICGRHSGSQGRRRRILHLRQCVESGQGLRAYRCPEPLRCEVENAGARYAQLAIQGPQALPTLQKLTRDRSRFASLLLVPGHRGLRCMGAHRTHRVYRRGWV